MEFFAESSVADLAAKVVKLTLPPLDCFGIGRYSLFQASLLSKFVLLVTFTASDPIKFS